MFRHCYRYDYNGELEFNDNAAEEVEDDEPPIEGARKAPDGLWYVQTSEGGFARVDA